MRLLINRDPVGWRLGLDPERNERDFFGQGSCEEVCATLMEHLGWLDDLKPLLEQNQFPASSADILRRHLDMAENATSGQEKDAEEPKSQGQSHRLEHATSGEEKAAEPKSQGQDTETKSVPSHE